MPKPRLLKKYQCDTCYQLAVFEGKCENHMSLQQQVRRNYNLKFISTRVNELVDNPGIKSLREEIAILRVVLETTLNRCQTEDEIMMMQGRIGDLVQRIEKLVSSCDRIEKSTSQMLDKSVVIQIAQTLIDIISKHVLDPDMLENIANEFSQATLRTIENDKSS